MVTVDTLDDSVNLNDGHTSLREAIFATNIVPGADTINFAPALTSGGPATLLLTQGELAISDALTINGPGANLLTIDAQQASRIFNITATVGDFSIAGLRLTNGHTVGGDVSFSGGAIRSLTTGQLTVAQCTIVNNHIEGDRADGGGIFSQNSVTVVDCTVSGNSASGLDGDGGGIRTNDILTLVRSTVSNNSTAGINAEGGGINAFNGANISDSLISGNKTTGPSGAGGGGVFVRFGTLLMSNSTVADNSTSGSYCHGGGLFVRFGNSTIAGSTISGNSTSGFYAYGGGIATDTGIIALVNCTISGNTTSYEGGAIASTGNSVSASSCTISDNSASIDAGGIFIFGGNATLDNTIVAGNTRGASGDASDMLGTVSLALSLLGVDTGATITDNGGNLIGTAAAPIDPLLGPLADNGGPTLSRALMPGSPALDAGDPAARAGVNGVPMFDQRGNPFARVYDIDGVGGQRIDIGAYEAAPFTLVVDTLVDESDGDFSAGDFSLREAIEFANSHAGHDTIQFSPALTAAGPATILLTHGELAITDAVTINGPGADLLTVDASGNDADVNTFGNGSRIFNIDDHSIQAIDVQIRDLKLTGGDTNNLGGAILSLEKLAASRLIVTGNHAASGGAIAFAGGGASISTLSDSTITHNVATNTGGACVVQGNSTASVVIANNTISANSARSGGAIYVGRSAPGAVTISGDIISDNSATQEGGAIYLSLSNTVKASLSQSTISGNTAVQQGGALFISNARDLAIIGSRITDNSSTSPSQGISRGGGIYVFMSDIAISASTITGNSALAGGGVYSKNGELAVNFSAIQNNIASAGNGGGIFSYRDRLSISGSTISGNSAGGTGLNGRGGGVWHFASSLAPATILDTAVAGNSASQYGGGVYWRATPESPGGSVLTLTNVALDGNSSARGGGVATGLGTTGATAGTLITSGGSISGNIATVNGGGVYDRSNAMTFSGTTIAGNRAGKSGGGIATPQAGSSPQSLSFFGAIIRDNVAATGTPVLGDGGGLWIPSGTVAVTSIGSQITGNSALRGGGIFRGSAGNPSPLTMIDSTLSGNTAFQFGGGIYNIQGGTLSFTRTAITGNSTAGTAGQSGGGVFNRQADILLVDSSLSGNSSAQGRGGGLYMSQSGDLSITGSTIAGNSARLDGGGIYVSNSSADRINIFSSTVSGNTSLQRASGIYLRGIATIRNSTITANQVLQEGSSNGALTAGDGNQQLELDHTIVAGNFAKNGTPDLRLVQGTLTVRFSLIGDNTGTSLVEAPLGSPDINGNLIGKPVNKGGSGIIDPKLGALTNNGGPTLTHALLPGSPAIDAGAIVTGPPLGYDQRGVPFSRAVDGNGDHVVRIDIGAYESQGVPSFSPGDYNQNGVVDAADYAKWRDTLGREGPQFAGADGNGNGRIDQADYEIWKSHFGQTLVIAPPAAGGGATADLSTSGTMLTATSQALAAPNLRPAVAARRSASPPAGADDALLAWLSLQPTGANPSSLAIRYLSRDQSPTDGPASTDAVDAVFDLLADDF